jgi:hypothetical protein
MKCVAIILPAPFCQGGYNVKLRQPGAGGETTGLPGVQIRHLNLADHRYPLQGIAGVVGGGEGAWVRSGDAR